MAERELPVEGTVGVCGVTGDVEEAILYRAEVEIGGVARVLISDSTFRCGSGVLNTWRNQWWHGLPDVRQPVHLHPSAEERVVEGISSGLMSDQVLGLH